MLALLTVVAGAADLEGNPTFGLFPGTAGLLVRPSRLGWEADPLLAVGASLDVGSPELDASGRGERWTRALVLALPGIARNDESVAGELTTQTPSGYFDPWLGVGLARAGDGSAIGLSLVLELDLDGSPASLEGLQPVPLAGASSITWEEGEPSRGEGDSGRAMGQDLDLALSVGFARLTGTARPRVDLVARYLRAGEFVRVAEGTTTVETPVDPYATTDPAEQYTLTAMVGANPGSFWGLPNRSAATLGAVFGLDRGGTLLDPRLRLEGGLAAGPVWPTFPETDLVEGRYTEAPSQTSTTYQGTGERLSAQLGATWGWVDDEERPEVRVRAGWRLDGLYESHDVERCTESCASTLDRTSYLKLTVPTAMELGVSERVTVSAGLLPSVYVYRYEFALEPASGDPTSAVDRDLVVGLGARAGLRYERDGWALGASFAGSSGTSYASAGVFGGSGGSIPAPVPRAPPRELTVAGPSLSVSPLLWIGWRPNQGS
jgi:hypothetical protein